MSSSVSQEEGDTGETSVQVKLEPDDAGEQEISSRRAEDEGAGEPSDHRDDEEAASSKQDDDATVYVKEEQEETPAPSVKAFVMADDELAVLEESMRATNFESNESAIDPSWKKEDRHIFILSSAGKPVYSRYGCEDKLVTLFGVMQALVSFVQDSDDVIQAVNFGGRVLAFLIKGPLILVAVSSKRESVRFLVSQLTYVYNQVVSVLTLTRVTRIFEQRHNYDLRRLLAGSERLIDHLLTFTETRAEFLLDGVECLPLSNSARDSISNAIVSTCSKIKNLVFAILIAENKLITLIHLKKYSLKPCDIHLIFNMVSTYESLRTAECWTPICLPNFDSSGYLHGHITYLTDDCQACLILLTVDAELFHELSEAKKKITEKLLKNQSITAINNSLKTPVVTMDAIGITHVKHFMYKCRKSSNILVPPIPSPYKESELLHQYQIVHNSMHEGPGNTPSLKLVHQHFATEIMIGWITDKFELYVTMDPLASKSIASDSIDKLLKWILKEEDKFFIANVPTF